MNNTLTRKLCSMCKESKERSEFSKSSRSSDGLQCYCNPCKAEKARIYRKANPEKHRESSRRWAAANPEKCADVCRAYRNKNRLKIAEKKADYRARNYDASLKRDARNRAKNRERRRLQSIAWRESNREKMDEYTRNSRASGLRSDSYNRGRAKKLGVPYALAGSVEAREIRAIYAEAIRLSKETGIQMHVDHIVPLTRGGEHMAHNLQILTETDHRQKTRQERQARAMIEAATGVSWDAISKACL